MSKTKRTPAIVSETAILQGAIAARPAAKRQPAKPQPAKSQPAKRQVEAVILRPTPEDTMACYIARRRRKMTILVCEHKQTFCAVRSLMHDEGQRTFFGQRIDGVVYGQQGAFLHAGVLPAFESHACRRRRGLARFTHSLRFARKPKVRYLYWGDVDSASIDQIMALYRANPGTLISPFMPAYRCMIDRAAGRKLKKSNGAEASPFCLRIAKHLDPRRRMAYEAVLAGGLRIPQQLVDKQVLRARKAG